MVEDRNDDGHTCMMCRMHGHGRNSCDVCGGRYSFMLLRVILALGVLAFVFWAGVAVGSMVSGAGGYDDYGGYGGGYRGMPRGMMYYDVGYPDGGGYRADSMMPVSDSGVQVSGAGKKIVPATN